MSEYRLKSSASDSNHNVMIINSPNFKLGDLASPVRLLRDTQSVQAEPTAQIGRTNVMENRKKMHVIEHNEEAEEDERIKAEEQYPWLLEDSEDHSFVGRFEGGQTSNYVLLVSHGNDFLVVPIHKWYKFNPKPQYRTLTLEEAERVLHSHKNPEAIWPGGSEVLSESITGSRALKESDSARKLRVASGNATTLNQNYYSKVYDENDLDFDVDRANFQDDEGDGLYNETEAIEDSINEPHKHSLHQKTGDEGLTKYGKELKNIMKRTNDPNLHLYFAGIEETKDPYASGPEEGEEYLLTPIEIQPAQRRGAAAEEDAGTRSPKRALSPSMLSPSSSQSSEKSTINEKMVIDFLKRAPTTTKKLVANFRQLIEQNPQNREVLTGILKKVAQIKETVEDDGQTQKMLELRNEYKVLSKIPEAE